MHRLVFPLSLLVAVLCCDARAQEASQNYAERMLRAGPFANQDSVTAWSFRQDSYPDVSGQYANQITDPRGERLYLAAITRDSMVWIQAPDSSMFALDAQVAWKIGLDAAESVGYDTVRTNELGYGWDSEKDELYLDLTQTAPMRSILMWAVALLALLALGIVWLIFKLRRSVEQAVERGRRLAYSRRRLADSREAERLHLARDLHDGPLQDLQAVRMRLGIAELAARGDQAAMGAETPPLDRAMADVQADVLRVIEELREISEGLRPPVLTSFGLAAAVRDLVTRQRTAHPAVDISLDFSDPGNDLSEGARLALYRIVQESTNNALRHGAPTQVHVAYSRTPDGDVSLSVTDDGRGFTVPNDFHDLEQDGHLGLAGMSERADSIQGRLNIASASGETRVEVHVPSESLEPIPA